MPSARRAIPKSCSRDRSNGATIAAAPQRHVCVRLSTVSGGAWYWRATAMASSRCISPRPGVRSRRLGDQGVPGHPGVFGRRSIRTALPSTSRSRTSSLIEPCSRACNAARRQRDGVADGPASSAKRYWDFHFRTETARSRRNIWKNSMALRAGGEETARHRCPGGLVSQRRHGYRRDCGDREPAQPDMRTFTFGFDMSSVSGLELAFDERKKPSGCRLFAAPSTTRWCLKRATWNASIDQSGLASGRAACRPVVSEFLCGQARQQIQQGGAVGRGRRRIVRRLPVAIFPRRRTQELRGIRRQIFSVLAAAIAGRFLARMLAPVWAR